MADLLDIAPSMAVEAVRVNGGQRITVQKIGADGIAYLIKTFPDLAMLVASGITTNTAGLLVMQFSSAICPIIAAGCGHHGDEKYEQAAARFLAEDQVKLLGAILRVTFPNGLAPFLEAVDGIAKGAMGELEKPVKVRLRKSPSASPSSSEAVSPPTLQ
jgi:hypothetical protein